MYDEIFKRIITASRNNSLTFFVGAGVSALSNAPKWSELIDCFCEEMGQSKKGKYSSDEYLIIPQMFYYSIDSIEDKYYSFINKCFDCSNLQPNIIHNMLFDLAPNSFITTNFDDLLEKSAIQNCQSFKAIACDNEVSEINGDKYILKIHGDLQHKNIVLKEEDYLNYSENFKLIETMLKSIFSTNTVVFIGYGLNDYNIKLILNWTKSLLKDHFNEPIFIYTDDKVLSNEELAYQDSRGLKVIKYYECIDDNNFKIDFFSRYKIVLQKIIEYSDYSAKGKNKIELFNLLFSLLEPLDKLNALKPQDIHSKLYPYAIVEQNGNIFINSNEINIFEYFIELNKMDQNQREKENLVHNCLEKYNVILSTFSKARIYSYKNNNTIEHIQNTNNKFADSICLSFDYCAMDKYISKTYTSLQDNYLKAYYLAKLRRFEESYKLFSDVAVNSFKEKNYLLFYFAQVNRKNIFQTMKYINKHINKFDLNKIDMKALNSNITDQIFENLPYEFKKTYSFLKDLNSANFLYKVSYESFIDGKKLQHSLDNGTIELGMSSSNKVICRINNDLHFILGNSLYIDEYKEFKNTMQNLMSLLVYKYSIQNRDNIHNSIFKDHKNTIAFDNIDFYCFIEFFNDKELKTLFNKYNIEELEFNNAEQIYTNIFNLINYYERAFSKSDDIIESSYYEPKIKTCLMILRYMKAPQNVIDKICKFILRYEFYNIHIDDKVLFLDNQLFHKKMVSSTTSKVVKETLVSYCDQHIQALNLGQKFEILSTNSDINYYDLIHFISPTDKMIGKKFAARINQMLNTNCDNFIKPICEHYFQYLSSNIQKKVIRLIKNKLNDAFSFEYFSYLIYIDAKLNDKILNQLIRYLDSCVTKINGVSNTKSRFHTDYFSDLNTVGYWCFIGRLPHDKFKKYMGISDYFDFFFSYEEFDFSKFSVKWLLEINESACMKIVEDNRVKNKIGSIIINEINKEYLSILDEKKLFGLLHKYFS